MKKFILLIVTACLPTAVSYGVLQCQKCREAHAKNKEKPLFSCHRIETMAKHLLLKHAIFVCCDCRRHFRDINSYRKHVFDIHKKYACRYCIWRHFKTRDAYELHKDAQHVDARWTCDTCRENFSTLERFAIHGTVRHGIYVCLYCAKEKNGNSSRKPFNFTEKDKYRDHMFKEHGKFVCMQCNLRNFASQEAFDNHCKGYKHNAEDILELCKFCGHANQFRYKAEKMLHELQHAFLLFFLQKTIIEYKCCIPFHKAVCNTRKSDKSSDEKEKMIMKAVRAFAAHVSQEHKRCLFCENPVTDNSRETLEKNLNSVTYRQIAEDARMFVRLKEDAFQKNEVPVIPCDMCGSALQPNRRSRLFFASIKEFPFGKGLHTKDHPFHYLTYDERKAEKNTMLSVIKEVPENEEESHFVPKKDKKDDVILGEEDETEDNGLGEEEEAEDEKEDEKEPDPKIEK